MVIQNFDYTLQLTPEHRVRLAFVSPQGDNAKAVLASLTTPDTPLDYGSELTPEQLQTLLVLNTLRASLSDKVKDASKNVDIEKLIAEVPNNNTWSKHIRTVTGQSSGTMNIHEINRRAKALGDSVRISAIAHTNSRNTQDFKNEVLLKYPSNFADPNYANMLELFVSDGNPSGIIHVYSPNSKRDVVTIYKDDIPILLGFTAQSQQGVIGSETLEALGKANAQLNIPGDLLEPTPEQRDAIFAEAIKAKDGIRSARDLNKAVDASANAMLSDPNSPYYGKGYTPRDLIEISKNNLLGSSGVSELATKITMTLQECLDDIRAFDMAIAYTSSVGAIDKNLFDDLLTSLRSERTETVKLYNELREYAAVLYDVKTPQIPEDTDADASRQNPEPVSVGALAVKGVLVLGAVAAAIILVLEIISLCKAQKLTNCKSIEESAADALKKIAEFLHQQIESATADTQLDFAAKSVFPAESSNKRIKALRDGGCASGYVAGFGCGRALKEVWDSSRGFDDKKAAILRAAQCFDAKAEISKKAAEKAEKSLNELKDESILLSLQNLLSKTTRTVTDILTYAGYTALGLGVLWGATKVYKAFKSDENA